MTESVTEDILEGVVSFGELKDIDFDIPNGTNFNDNLEAREGISIYEDGFQIMNNRRRNMTAMISEGESNFEPT